MQIRFFAVGLALLISSCGTAPKLADHPQFNVSECEGHGGVFKRVGRAQVEVCAVPYADAGKTCSDKSDCIGVCIASYSEGGSQTGAGTCQTDNAPLFGCYSLVEKGVLRSARCVD
jgi:hypothetical protein